MTGGGVAEPGDGLVPGDLAALHRTAVLLTEDADLALDLVARVLRQRTGPSPSPRRSRSGTARPPHDALDQLRGDVVRAYLRSATRHRDGMGRERGTGAAADPAADPYDVLRALRPRARAVTVLRVAHGWDLTRAAAAVGSTTRRVDALLPDAPGLDRALEAVAEQHRLSSAEVVAALEDSSNFPGAGADRGRRWRTRLLVGAGAAAAAATWFVLTQPAPGADAPLHADADTLTDLPAQDLTPYGWHLDEHGQPPAVAMGLQRQAVVEIPYDEPAQEITWDAGHLVPGGPAGYAVLWCDLPPVDPHIVQPTARLTSGPVRVDLPCAGREDGPPVREVTPVPVSGPAQVELVGDLPRAGGATLAFYREGALSATLPLPDGSPGIPAPQVPPGAAAVDTVLVPRDWAGRTRVVGSVQVSAGTELQVWAGRTGSVSVFVDGLPVTDDGDLTGSADPDWRRQQLDLRDGRWVVYLPGTSRTFPLPEQVRPPAGQTRTVTVEVFTQGMQQDHQVLATQAVPVAPASVGAHAVPLDSPALAGFPPLAGGYRMVGAWNVPQDGLGHDLGPGLAPGAELVAFTGSDLVTTGADRDESWGLAEDSEGGIPVVRPLPLAPGDPDQGGWTSSRLDPWQVQQDLTVPAAGSSTTPRVWLPAVVGHPRATVLALEPTSGGTDLEDAPPPPSGRGR